MSKAKASRGGKPGNNSRVTWAQATRDVINRAMSTGQMLPLGIFILLVIIFWRVSPEELASVLHEIVNGLMDGMLLGWILCATSIVCWAAHVKRMRKMFSDEAERIGKEKTNLQQARTDQPLGTSEN
ncbi:hypothetical protein ACSOQT_001992 [Yersinia enterocolitica]|nr:hypothetical protein [Yersinia enterocolitica]ELI8151256.1 hypothetical protein [Yersinia enterocolitica]HDL6946932.1 hypothetical protein [Yersinia enterocolitica]